MSSRECSSSKNRSRRNVEVVPSQATAPSFRSNSVLISFSGGVPLPPLPLQLPQRIRAITSAPDTLRPGLVSRRAIRPIAFLGHEILSALKVLVIGLRREIRRPYLRRIGAMSTHPIALTYWEALGNEVDESELIETSLDNNCGII